jgi:enoyl-CoA hydratase/carnithine racemase
VLARKGVLSSDVSVADMSYAAWMLEAQALQKSEASQAQFFADMVTSVLQHVRRMMSRMLGLDIFNEKGDVDSFVPLVQMLAPPGQLAEIQKQIESARNAEKRNTEEQEDAFLQAFETQMFEAGDMEPFAELTAQEQQIDADLRARRWSLSDDEVANLGIVDSPEPLSLEDMLKRSLPKK